MSNGIYDDYESRLLTDGSDEKTEEKAEENELIEEDSEEEANEYYELPLALRSRSLIWSVVSFSSGILSLALCMVWFVSIFFAIGAIGTSLVSRKNLGFFEKWGILGLIFGIMGIVFGISFAIAKAIGIF